MRKEDRLLFEKFRARSMHKTALAKLYAPELTESGARNRLRDWIAQTRGLLDALLAVGYTHTQRVLTRRQVEVIVEFLGDP